MSVRPITVGEETKALGHPFVNILSLFGATQGMLIFLNRRKIPIQNNWFAAPGAFSGFLFLVLGGYLTGGCVGMAVFSDWQLLRLSQRHSEDLSLIVDGHSVKSISF